jgi:Superinfection immunity protein
VLGSVLGIYIAPFVIAVSRDHHRLPWIGFLNFAAGWTIAGRIAALVWSLTAIPPANSDHADYSHCAWDHPARSGVNLVLPGVGPLACQRRTARPPEARIWASAARRRNAGSGLASCRAKSAFPPVFCKVGQAVG